MSAPCVRDPLPHGTAAAMSGLTGGALSKIYWESNTGGSSGNPVLQACLRGRRLALGCTPRPALCCRTPRSAVRSARGPPRRVGRRERLLTGSRGRGRSCRSWMSSASPRTMVRLAPADAQRCRAAWQRGRQPRAQNCPAVPGAANLRARAGGGAACPQGQAGRCAAALLWEALEPWRGGRRALLRA